MIYGLLRRLLFLLPPETAHQLAFTALVPLERLLERTGWRQPAPDPVLRQTLWGLDFPSPIGLAAGLDKNAALPHVWQALGFGFAELGTVTAQPQSGNPPPRIFRLPQDRALINRLGFNNDGAGAVAAALALRLRHRRPCIPLGINLGKSRSVPLAEAAADYRSSLRALFPLADYVVINVSSPNTPGLRDLQSAARLEDLLSNLQEENRQLAGQWQRPPRPLLIKVAPDLTEEELNGIVGAATRGGAVGMIATNTTTDRPPLRAAQVALEAGGLSGAPLRERSTEVIRTVYRCTEGRLPIIGVGGIFDADGAYEKIRAGASLVQIYTGLVYEGPALPCRLAAALRVRLARDGFANVRDAVGRDA